MNNRKNVYDNEQCKFDKRVNEIFDDLQITDRPEDDPGIFVRVEKINYSGADNEAAESAELSVISKKIYDYDSNTVLAIGGNFVIDNYRPYFVSLIVYIDNENSGFFEELGYDWVPVKLHNVNYTGENRAFSAKLMFGINSLEIKNRKIEILNDKKPPYLFGKKEINKLVKEDYSEKKLSSCIKNVKDIKRILASAWKNTICNYIDIYNVGKGNADYIVGNNHKILYDIGHQCPYPEEKDVYFPKATTEFGELNPDLVIISHWDLDHYIGCLYASDDIFKVNWIAPTLTSDSDKIITLNSFRLAAYLKALNKLVLVKRIKKRTETKSFNVFVKGRYDNIFLRMGGGSDEYVDSPRNREGLYIEISKAGDWGSVLMGDVPYNCVVESIFKIKKLKLLHVPHHCSPMELEKLDGSSWGGNDGQAVITTCRVEDDKIYDEGGEHREILRKKFGKNVHYTIGSSRRKNVNDIKALRIYRCGDFRVRT